MSPHRINEVIKENCSCATIPEQLPLENEYFALIERNIIDGKIQEKEVIKRILEEYWEERKKEQ